ncbi:MAG: hypothetical protein IKD69_09320, partial [Solobacterium sp.]|nr:hypothetical protein [Solobacterium sp.]
YPRIEPGYPAPEVEAPVAKELVYTGNEQELVDEGSAIVGTMYYAVTEDETAPAADQYSEDIPTAVNAGTYYVWYMAKGEAGYGESEPAYLTVTIEKAVPEYEIPQGLSAVYGQKLNEIALPEGWAWNDDTQVVEEDGLNVFPASYTPADTDNYIVVENIEVPVAVDAYTGFRLADGTPYSFVSIDKVLYWYEDDVRQGTYEDKNGVKDTQYGNLVRGREIYDPTTDAWYWLDACYEGAVASGKEVWIPYIFQGEEPGSTDGKWVRYDDFGQMVKGWYANDDGFWYYDLITGAMYKGTHEINGKTYTFDPLTGVMQK